MSHSSETTRRTLLQLVGGLTTASLLPALPRADATKPAPTGKPGDFDFLSGEWKIDHRWFDGEKWLEFEGEATVVSMLEGAVSVEELRIPARDFFGIGLRLLDSSSKLWADYWIPSGAALIEPPPAWGSFVDGIGLWESDGKDGEQPIISRGAWDQITKNSCRWYSAVSRDDGKSWQESWVMKWRRAGR